MGLIVKCPKIDTEETPYAIATRDIKKGEIIYAYLRQSKLYSNSLEFIKPTGTAPDPTKVKKWE